MENKITLSVDWNDKPEGKPLGLIIKHIKPAQDQRHVGFIFPDVDNNPVLAHFAWHKDFRETSNVGDYAMHWLQFLPERTAIPIIMELCRIKEVNNIPYGIIHKEGTKFVGGNMIPTCHNQGESLTCSTFVLCILEQFAFPIIARETWEIPEDDIKWQKDILQALEGLLSKDIMNMQLDAIGKFPRITPEQIVGACAVFNYTPVNYQDACQAGLIVIKKLQELKR